MKVAKVTIATKAKELRRAPRNLSQEESVVDSSYAMVAMEVGRSKEEPVLRIETRMTTRNMQIETGAMIRTSSSPKSSRMVEDDDGDEVLRVCGSGSAIFANRRGV